MKVIDISDRLPKVEKTQAEAVAKTQELLYEEAIKLIFELAVDDPRICNKVIEIKARGETWVLHFGKVVQ